jgi:hypothetical protein
MALAMTAVRHIESRKRLRKALRERLYFSDLD